MNDADRAAIIEAFLDLEDEEGPFRRPVYLALFGTRHSGRGERRCEASIGYYNRKRFMGRDVARTTGERVDGAFLLRHITRLCERAQPRGLFFEPEQAVCIPFNYHLVFHSSYTGFVDDLREIAHFWLWGGRGFTDDRHDWPPLYTLEDNESMLLAGRSDYASVVLLDDLHRHFELLEALFGGLDVPEELVYEAAVNAQGIEPMDTTRGLGIVAEPFLRRYCGDYYLDLLNRIRAWLDVDPEAADAAARAAMVPRALGLYLRPGERSMPLHRPGAIAAELGLA
ncbi:hypothetical protein, partial [Haliangium sp.]|uniref:hypothetical protein n=1 Tax=Haliangium sp. TaxID=2663208 RepID=UPI003D0DE1D5